MQSMGQLFECHKDMAEHFYQDNSTVHQLKSAGVSAMLFCIVNKQLCTCLFVVHKHSNDSRLCWRRPYTAGMSACYYMAVYSYVLQILLRGLGLSLASLRYIADLSRWHNTNYTALRATLLQSTAHSDWSVQPAFCQPACSASHANVIRHQGTARLFSALTVQVSVMLLWVAALNKKHLE